MPKMPMVVGLVGICFLCAALQVVDEDNCSEIFIVACLALITLFPHFCTLFTH